ncbi:MAG: phospholipase D family protein [Ramlibacter sp.]|nr:phospholipase D family protein [Ramlibacter sp.]
MTDTADTRLARSVAPGIAAHPGKSGIYPLRDAHEAFAARVWLARVAERTLDVQYYIWHQDLSGTLLFEALHDAANRGVRVRLLLDDNNTSGLDATLAALHRHPNIEVRLFNPFLIRQPRAIGYLTDFSRLNRRMHNKSFTADNQVTIVGGRNVGDEYFGATDGSAFIDLDVMAVGPVVSDMSADFDRYWSSGSSYPLDLLVPAAEPTPEIQTAVWQVEHDPAAAAYVQAVRDTPLMRELVERRLDLEWVPTRMVSDDPAKGLGVGRAQPMMPQLLQMAGQPQKELQLVSAYFVPGDKGVNALVAMAQRGVKVSVLTNSLEATDVAPVHSGYAKRRKPLLEGGVKLYELRKQATELRRKWLSTMMQSSASSLHAKTFSIDRSRVFIGSFNFDPRSINLNTEMGFLIDSPKLAGQIASVFDDGLASRAYEVRIDEQDRLYWLEQRDGRTIRLDTEPGTTFWQRAAVWFMSLLPIDWLL